MNAVRLFENSQADVALRRGLIQAPGALHAC